MIAVCIIMKNESAYLEACLASLKGLYDELIIVDTGSSDNSVEIAEMFGAEVRHFKWVNDFSAARNESIKDINSDWIFYIDADEILSEKDIIRMKELVASTPPEVWGYLCDQRNYTSDSKLRNWRPSDDYKECKGPGFFVSKIVRLFRNRPEIKFHNKIHEIVDDSILENNGVIKDSGIQIHHYGYLKGSDFMEEKRKKYLAIGLEQVKENPEDPRPAYEVAKVYKNTGELEKAKKFIQKVIELNPDYKLAFTNYGEILSKIGDIEGAKKAYFEAIKRKSNSEYAFINLGVIYANKGDIDRAIDYLDKALAINPKSAPALNNAILILLKAQKYKSAKRFIDIAIKRTGMAKFKQVREVLKKRIPSLYDNY